MNSGPKWSLRNGSQYRRLCARAGCGSPASVTLRFQPTQRQAWLVELDEHAARTQGDLCNRHAAALVLPRGWELHDERAVRGRTAGATGNADRATAATNGNADRAGRTRARPTTATADPMHDSRPQLDLDRRVDVPADVDDAVGTDDLSDHAPGAPFGSRDDDEVEAALGAVLDAQTPLLRRAFRNAKPR
ncbi:MAG: DUF3499 family protein [Acidimicrobiia bacterium]